jgi:hypothetical protein
VSRPLLVLAFVLFGTLPASGAGDATWTASDSCGSCHRDIYRVWRDSMHARSMEEPFFLDAYRETEGTRGRAAAVVCVRCHAPMAVLIGDLALERRISWEGVTCDYCHGVTGVQDTKHGPVAKLAIGKVKRGPIRDAASNGHEVEYSELHTQSRFCAPCHEYTNGDGVPVLTTFSEWKSSRAAERGATCQTCHMALTEADVVDPRIARSSQAQVNLHEMPGAHTIRQLLTALKVDFEATQQGDELELRLTLDNVGAGHAVPTGMPGRRVILQVDLAAAGRTFSERRVYGKQFENDAGTSIDHVADYFAGGVRERSDTRIQADESRRESFRFPVPAQESATAEFSLIYEHLPRGEDGERESFVFYSDRKYLKPRG